MRRDPSKFFNRVVMSCKNVEQLEVASNMINVCPELYYNDTDIEAYGRQAYYEKCIKEMREYLKRLNNE